MSSIVAINSPPRRGHLFFAAAGLTLLAIYGSFVPLEYRAIAWATAVEHFRAIRWLNLGVYKRADLVANLLLFVPLGFCWLGAVDLDRRSRAAAIVVAPLIVLALAGLAVGIEFAQQWFPRRTVSLNDIVAEMVGGFCGVVLWFVVGRMVVRAIRRVTEPAGDVHPLARLLRLYALGLVLYSIQPLDLTFSPAEIARKIADGKVHLLPFQYDYGGVFQAAWGMGINVLLFVPIGMMFRLAKPGRSIRSAMLMTLMFALGIELVQLFVFSRFVDATDVLMGALGGLIGGACAPRNTGAESVAATHRSFSIPTRLIVALGLSLLYSGALAAAFWHPFHLQRDHQIVVEQLRGIIDIPFRKLYFGSEFSALSHIMRAVMLFLPLGAVWRWACGRELDRSLAARALVVMLVLAVGLVIEIGQAFMIDQYADTTDLLLYLAGAWAGWRLWPLLAPGGRSAGSSPGRSIGRDDSL